jgi:hypothetical protein
MLPTGTIYDYDFLSPNYVSNKKKNKNKNRSQKRRPSILYAHAYTHTHAESSSSPLLVLVLHRPPSAWRLGMEPVSYYRSLYSCTLFSLSPYFRLYAAYPYFTRERHVCECVVSLFSLFQLPWCRPIGEQCAVLRVPFYHVHTPYTCECWFAHR